MPREGKEGRRLPFAAVPAWGHVLPLLDLAEAAVRQGHTVAFLSADTAEPMAAPHPVLAAGPDFGSMVQAANERHPDATVLDFSPTMLAEAFVRVRIELGATAAIERIQTFAPDLIIAEEADFLGPLGATALSIPWVQQRLGIELPTEVVQALLGTFRDTAATRGLTVRIASAA